MSDSIKTEFSPFETPVLFIVFNNPEITKRTFDAIKAIEPKYLYLAADGHRSFVAGEREKCEKVLNLVKRITWACEVKTLFKNNNSGSAAAGITSALKWFFSQVDEGIVLEYDVIPSLDFFYFCSEMLEKYRDNKEILVITGSNFDNMADNNSNSYFLTRLPTLWGFATWSRAFKIFNLDLNNFTPQIFYKSIPYSDQMSVNRYWRWKFNATKKGEIDDWAYPILFSIWIAGGYGLNSSKNLVTHFVEGNQFAENFKFHVPGITNLPVNKIYPLKHPAKLKINLIYDHALIDIFKLKITRKRFIYMKFRNFIPDFVVNFIKIFFCKRYQ
jgi:hypothetical protein